MSYPDVATTVAVLEDRVKNIGKEIDEVQEDLKSLKKEVKEEYTPKSTTSEIDGRVKKFEGLWDWFLKIVFGAIVLALLAIIGLGGK